MLKNLYTIKDIKIEAFNAPFLAYNNADAERTFTIAANDPTQVIHQSPADFELYEIGTYDDTNAGIFLLDKPILIKNAFDVMVSK